MSVSLLLLACVSDALVIGEGTDVSGDTGLATSDTGEAPTGDTGGTPDTDPPTDEPEACLEYPIQPLYDGGPLGDQAPWEPYWLLISFVATVGDELLQDMLWQGEPVSSYLTLDFFSEGAEESCAIYYDLSESERSTQTWWTDTGGLLFDAWDLVLRDGYTDCPPIAADLWGTNDLRQLVEQHSWGFGLGEAWRVEDYLRSVVDDFGAWEPYLMGGYVMTSAYSPDTAYEISYGLSFEADCGEAWTNVDGSPVYREAVEEGPLPDGIGYAAGLYGLTVETLR